MTIPDETLTIHIIPQTDTPLGFTRLPPRRSVVTIHAGWSRPREFSPQLFRDVRFSNFCRVISIPSLRTGPITPRRTAGQLPPAGQFRLAKLSGDRAADGTPPPSGRTFVLP
ncbi:hypothetical protein [Frankia gtarii]|uniref:hypothetical protein n=1 Tax=Frankia gtarii TaxID=2950102 RepID=UPI0021BE99CA|nr:hypothetical protein [Frankia gtarii]